MVGGRTQLEVVVHEQQQPLPEGEHGNVHDGDGDQNHDVSHDGDGDHNGDHDGDGGDLHHELSLLCEQRDPPGGASAEHEPE